MSLLLNSRVERAADWRVLPFYHLPFYYLTIPMSSTAKDNAKDTQIIEVTTTHLQMLSAAALRPSPRTAMKLIEAEVPCPELNRFLYSSVGGPWYWVDRLSWSYAKWLEYLDRDELTTWVGYWKGTPAGFFELHRQADNVEIAYFGLLPRFIGQGLGGDLLTRAIQNAWSLHPSRIWVYTCSLDGPAAMNNYQSRGFTVYQTNRSSKCLPAAPLGPWPGHCSPGTA